MIDWILDAPNILNKKPTPTVNEQKAMDKKSEYEAMGQKYETIKQKCKELEANAFDAIEKNDEQQELALYEQLKKCEEELDSFKWDLD